MRLVGASFGMVYRLCRELYLHKSITESEARQRVADDKKFLTGVARSLKSSNKELQNAVYVYNERWKRCLKEKNGGKWGFNN
jgi:hypothetical protein